MQDFRIRRVILAALASLFVTSFIVNAYLFTLCSMPGRAQTFDDSNVAPKYVLNNHGRFVRITPLQAVEVAALTRISEISVLLMLLVGGRGLLRKPSSSSYYSGQRGNEADDMTKATRQDILIMIGFGAAYIAAGASVGVPAANFILKHGLIEGTGRISGS